MVRFGRMGVVLAALGAAGAAPAAPAHPLSLGLGVSTLGYGYDADWRFNRYLSVSVGHAAFHLGGRRDTNDSRYDGQLRFSNTLLLLNLHPFAGGFQVSLGIARGSIRAGFTGAPHTAGTWQFNGVEYTAPDVGNLYAQIDFKLRNAWYYGVGYRAPGPGLGPYAQLGLVATRLTTRLWATGPIADDPKFRADLGVEQTRFESQSHLTAYPVIGVGVMYRF